MKSFTSLEQSEKLTRILPLESADMTWEKIVTNEALDFYWRPTIGFNRTINDNLFSYRFSYVMPCWSLGALLDILPLEVSIGKQTDGVDTYYYIASYDARYCDVYSHRHINVIDACVEMIVKLKEKKVI